MRVNKGVTDGQQWTLNFCFLARPTHTFMYARFPGRKGRPNRLIVDSRCPKRTCDSREILLQHSGWLDEIVSRILSRHQTPGLSFKLNPLK
jgi:hypothetical protein